MNSRKQILVALMMLGIALSPELALAKHNKKKQTEAVPTAISYESRLQEWNKTESASRGQPEHLCEKEHQRLSLVMMYFKGVSASFPTIPETKTITFKEALKNPDSLVPEALMDNAEWHQFKLQEKIRGIEPLMNQYAGSEGWARQEKVLHQYLTRMRSSTPYTVMEQAEPFEGMKDLLKIQRGMADIFREMESAYAEWNRIIDFDRLEKLGLQDNANYTQTKQGFLMETIDPIIECQMDYLSHF